MVIWTIAFETTGKISINFRSTTWEIPPLELDTIEELIDFLKTDVIRTEDRDEYTIEDHNEYIDFMNKLQTKHYHRWEEINKRHKEYLNSLGLTE